MNIIEITTTDNPKQTVVYDLMRNKLCSILPSTKQEVLYHYLLKYPDSIDYAIIELKQPYRNTLYALFPNIKVSIHRQSVEKLFTHTLGMYSTSYEEVAATQVVECQDEVIDVQQFVKAFYSYHTKEEALAYYHKWVSEVPLGINEVYRLIRIMEFYLDEILAYFELKQLKIIY